MHTDSTQPVDMVFNAPLYGAMIAMVWAALRCDRAEVFFPFRETAVSVEELGTLVHEQLGAWSLSPGR